MRPSALVVAITLAFVDAGHAEQNIRSLEHVSVHTHAAALLELQHAKAGAEAARQAAKRAAQELQGALETLERLRAQTEHSHDVIAATAVTGEQQASSHMQKILQRRAEGHLDFGQEQDLEQAMSAKYDRTVLAQDFDADIRIELGSNQEITKVTFPEWTEAQIEAWRQVSYLGSYLVRSAKVASIDTSVERTQDATTTKTGNQLQGTEHVIKNGDLIQFANVPSTSASSSDSTDSKDRVRVKIPTDSKDDRRYESKQQRQVRDGKTVKYTSIGCVNFNTPKLRPQSEAVSIQQTEEESWYKYLGEKAVNKIKNDQWWKNETFETEKEARWSLVFTAYLKTWWHSRRRRSGPPTATITAMRVEELLFTQFVTKCKALEIGDKRRNKYAGQAIQGKGQSRDVRGEAVIKRHLPKECDLDWHRYYPSSTAWRGCPDPRVECKLPRHEMNPRLPPMEVFGDKENRRSTVQQNGDGGCNEERDKFVCSVDNSANSCPAGEWKLKDEIANPAYWIMFVGSSKKDKYMSYDQCRTLAEYMRTGGKHSYNGTSVLNTVTGKKKAKIDNSSKNKRKFRIKINEMTDFTVTRQDCGFAEGRAWCHETYDKMKVCLNYSYHKFFSRGQGADEPDEQDALGNGTNVRIDPEWRNYMLGAKDATWDGVGNNWLRA